MADNNQGMAKVDQLKHWSPVWIFPIVTVLIGIWILGWHYSHQGALVTLITTNAEGIEGGKTAIKSRSVTVGTVESAELSDDLHHVEIKARLNAGMEKLLHNDSVFWVVKPAIGREGVTGLGTLLSGAYIELQPGNKGHSPESYQLLDAPPLAPPDAKGLRIVLDSEKAGQLNPGDPVLFRGYRVGSVETSSFDPKLRAMRYQLFVSAPYDSLVTTNVRFWKESGVAVDMSTSGMRVQLGSLTTLFSGGVSFDLPQGWEMGKQVKNHAEYHLYDDQRSIQNSLYTQHHDYLLFFSDSVRGLQTGAPVEFRGVRLGTVTAVPAKIPGTSQQLNDDYRIPVLMRIEPDRFKMNFGENFNFEKYLQEGKAHGLRASMKTGNLLTGLLYIDLDFYDNAQPYKGPDKLADYEIIPTVSSGLDQIQQKLMTSLDKINNLPLNPLINQATATLSDSQRTLRELQKTLNSVNQMMASPAMKALPQDMQQTLRELNRSMKGFQPGSPAYNKLVGDMQHLDQILRELQPILRTLNKKSNALVFEVSKGRDPQPVRAKQ
ncbi:intermembrane transport protein PqiB [Enterobacteriaceae bacterium LUAb1]